MLLLEHVCVRWSLSVCVCGREMESWFVCGGGGRACVFVCVCLCVCERERWSLSVCECVFVCVCVAGSSVADVI